MGKTKNMGATKKIELGHINIRKYIIHFAILGLMDLLLIIMALANPVFCNNYANGLYSHIAEALSFFTNAWEKVIWADILVGLGILAIAYVLGRILYTVLRYHAKATRFHIFYILKRTGLNCAVVLLLLVFFYMWGRGLLYNRVDFATANGDSAGLYDLSSYSDDEIMDMAQEQLELANELSLQLSDSYSENLLMEEAQAAYTNVRASYPGLNALTIKVKADYPLGLTTLTGNASFSAFFTFEGIYNDGLAGVARPYAAAKALAGLSGYARDEDVSAIAYRICMVSSSVEFRYSGTCTACYAIITEAERRGLDVTSLQSELSSRVQSDYQCIAQLHSESH